MAFTQGSFAACRAMRHCGFRGAGFAVRAPRSAPIAFAPPTLARAAPELTAGRPTAWWLRGVRCFSSEGRKEGVMRMWNEDRGFGFITPAGGGDDVFVHRSALQEGCALSAGASVTYDEAWDSNRRKYRAADVAIADGASAPATSSTSGATSGGSSAAPSAGAAPREHHIVAACGEWAITKDPMGADGSSGKVRHRLVVRSDAPQAKDDKKFRREEFQIVGDATWEKRLYPAGGDREEVIVLQPGGQPSQATSGRGKGHGRNWAVEGRPGTAFDILYDPEARAVSCELAFNETR